MEIWNESSEQLQQVINCAIQELEELERCFEESSKCEMMIKTEHDNSIRETKYIPASRSSSIGNSPVKSILKTPDNSPRKGSKPVVIDRIIEQDRLMSREEGDLSGQVLIVNDDISIGIDKDDNSEDISEERTVTVTGEDGVRHQVQFGLGSIEEEEDEDDPGHEITAEMASVATCNVNEQPEQCDETSHRVVRTREDGSQETVFQCEMCSKEFATGASLTSHRWQHTKPFQCEHCKARFASKGNLVIHRRRHTGDRPYVCTVSGCDSRFTTRGNLKRHLQSHTGAKPFQCTQCDGRFTEKKSLKIHMRKHTGERPYSCRYCGKSFAQASILKSHIAMHLDQRSHLCDLCGRGFRQKTQLRQHEKRHKGVKKYNCEMCESQFFVKAELDRHMKSHLGTKSFSCTLCQKSFTRQQTLNEHMNRHYGLKPFQCKICGQAFSEMSAVYKHLKSHSDKTNKDGNTEVIIHKLPVTSTENNESVLKDVVINVDSKLEHTEDNKIIYVNM